MAIEFDFTEVLQADWIINILCKDDGGNALNISAGNVRFRASQQGVRVIDIGVGTGVVLTDPLNGAARVRVTPALQEGSPAVTQGQIQYEIDVVLADGTIVDQAYGNIDVLPSLFAV